MLKRHGVTRVRPLLGGLDAWISAGFPVVGLEPHGVSSDSSDVFRRLDHGG